MNFSLGHFSFCFQIGISVDTKGNIALQVSLADGLTSGDNGFSIVDYRMVTNAPSVKNLEGSGYQFGGSVTVPVEDIPIVVGGDVNFIPDNEKDTTYHGFTISSGVGVTTDETPTAGGEVHAAISDTSTVFGFNIFETVKKVFEKVVGGNK